MANQTEEKQKVSAYNQDDAKEFKQPESDVSAYGQEFQADFNQSEIKPQATPAQTSLNKPIGGKCPPGTTRDPLTGECV